MRHIVAIACVLLASCQSEEEKVREEAIEKAIAAVKRQLNDPYSAKFEHVTYRYRVVCGTVNAKNLYGAYVGAVPFVVRGTKVTLGMQDDGSLESTVENIKIQNECMGGPANIPLNEEDYNVEIIK